MVLVPGVRIQIDFVLDAFGSTVTTVHKTVKTKTVPVTIIHVLSLISIEAIVLKMNAYFE